MVHPAPVPPRVAAFRAPAPHPTLRARRVPALGLLLLAGLAAGCSDPGLTGVPGVRAVSLAEVAQCRQLTTIGMAPPVYGPLSAQGITYARNRIMADAAEAGASHVVFTPVEPGALVTEITATAWACPAPA